MKCLKCGTELEADALFCTECGAKIAAEVAEEVKVEPQTPVAAKEENAVQEKKKSFSPKAAGKLVGAALLVIGLITVLGAGTSISNASFGGEFYTYAYQGIVSIAEQLAAIQRALGWIIIAVGTLVELSAFRD